MNLKELQYNPLIYAFSTTLNATKWFAESTAIAGFIMCGAWVKIPLPFTPVPITLQTLAVLSAALCMPNSQAFTGIFLYIVLGLLGAPLFAVPFGPTFGYILGFLLVPIIVGNIKNKLFALLTSMCTIYCTGIFWLICWTRCSITQGILMGMLPFIPADLLKIMIAYQLYISFKNIFK